MTVVKDTSDPNGDDFPFPGIFLTASGQDIFNAGPSGSPEVPRQGTFDSLWYEL